MNAEAYVNNFILADKKSKIALLPIKLLIPKKIVQNDPIMIIGTEATIPSLTVVTRPLVRFYWRTE